MPDTREHAQTTAATAAADDRPRPVPLPPDTDLAQALADLREEVAGGLLYTHSQSNANASRLLEAASFLYALIELLAEKGTITIAELDERKSMVAERVQKRFLKKGLGVMLQDPERDKYAMAPQEAPQIDCENRIHLCKASCCRLWFPLSRQDVEEGIVQWDLQLPYIIAQDEQGYCRHQDRGSCRCTIYEHRPLPCRAFDCRNDKRIWLDFENRVINPDLDAMFPKRPERGAPTAGQPPLRPAANGDMPQFELAVRPARQQPDVQNLSEP